MIVVYRIYGLSGPDGVVRYVGRTKGSLEQRARNHLGSVKSGRRPIHAWLKEQGAALVVRELERVERRSRWDSYCPRAAEREEWWIAHFLAAGNDLFNVKGRPKTPPFTVIPLEGKMAVCGLCERRADDPAVVSCTHTDCGLSEKRAA